LDPVTRPARRWAEVMAASAAMLTAGALASAVSAQESQASVCVVSIGRGATVPGGAIGAMTVRNVGRACRIVNFTVPEQRVATSRLEVTGAPAHGRLEIVQPNIVAYVPDADYRGPDEFHYGGRGPGREGRTLPFSVRIEVRVVSPDTPLR
jgi:hypothetical protein